MNPPETKFTFTFTPLAMWDEEDQVWYPAVKRDQFGTVTTCQYIIGFEDQATALTFARTFAQDEAASAKRRLDASMDQMRKDFGGE